MNTKKVKEDEPRFDDGLLVCDNSVSSIVFMYSGGGFIDGEYFYVYPVFSVTIGNKGNRYSNPCVEASYNYYGSYAKSSYVRRPSKEEKTAYNKMKEIMTTIHGTEESFIDEYLPF